MANDTPNQQKAIGLSEVLSLSNSGKRLPALSLVRDQTALAAMASKSIAAPDKVNYTTDGTRKITLPDVGRLNTIANKKARDISEARTVMQMLPDLELAAKIRISAVLSPKDLMTVELVYSAPAGIVPAGVLSQITSAVNEHIENVYKIKTKLPRMLREIMFEKGAFVAAVLAENAIDELINRHNSVSMESVDQAMQKVNFNGNYGFLGPSDTIVPNIDTPRTAKPIRKLSDRLHNPGLESIDLEKTYGKPNFASLDRSSNWSALRLDFTGRDDPADPNAPATTTATGRSSQKLADKYMIPEIVFTDNPNVLRAPLLEEKLRKDRIKEQLGISNVGRAAMESYATPDGKRIDTSKIDDRKLEQLLQKPRRNGWHQMMQVKAQSQLQRSTIGSPLIMELPPEAVIPVYKPGQEEKHVGYFVLLDQTGNPVRMENYQDVYADMSNRFNFTESSQSSTVIDRLKQLTNGFQCSNIDHLDNTTRIWGDMVEADFAARLRNSLHTNGVVIAKNHDYYRLMLSRMLSQQRTTILFLPVETTEYFAMKYDQNGVGISYMDEMKVLNNMQAIVIFANTMAALKNSIARTDVTMTIDPEDPDPQKTIDILMDVLMRNNQSAFPLGIDSPADLVNYLSRAQYKFNIDGHPGLPSHKLEFQESQTNYGKVDTELSEDLNKRQMRSLGVDPEIINNGMGRDMTATEIMSNNLMLSKTAMTDQEILNPQLTSYVRKIIRVDQPLLEDLREIIDGSFDQLQIDKVEIAKELGLDDDRLVRGVVVSHLLNQVIEKIEVALPRPNTTSERSQLEAMETHEQLVDKCIEAYISSSFFTEQTGGEVSRIVDDIKANLKAMMMRQFMAENGIMAELGKMMNREDSNEETKSFWDQNRDYGKILMELLGDYWLKINEAKLKANKVAQAVGDSLDGGGSIGSFDQTQEEKPAGDDPLSMDFGGDDFSSPKPPGEEEEQTEESSTTTTTSTQTNDQSGSAPDAMAI